MKIEISKEDARKILDVLKHDKKQLSKIEAKYDDSTYADISRLIDKLKFELSLED